MSLHHCYLLKTYLLNILIIMKIETDTGRFNLFYNKNTDILNTPISLLKKISGIGIRLRIKHKILIFRSRW